MKHTQTLTLALIILLLAPFAHAVAQPAKLLITSQPSTLKANQNLNISFNVTQPMNDWENIVAQLYVNGANTYNQSFLNITPTTNGYLNSILINEGYYVDSDSVVVSFLVTDNGNTTHAANTSVTNTTNSTTWSVLASTTSILPRDTFSGLGSVGSGISNFMTGITPGIGQLLFALAIVGVIVGLFLIIAYGIRKATENGFSVGGLKKGK